ncbi:hypothetical protein [Gordonia soli]|uniref:Uncharacterized protein n=1 Tax=Gordonia soli NBRC 108243 TaxID=1223545 RepID=M0QHE9_9ACTN|nr:hypothetical protein [Gordonia soli]GAC66842.1 hypothetical protein GS4_05_00510 [Gordonia soli NBRC 108243]
MWSIAAVSIAGALAAAALIVWRIAQGDRCDEAVPFATKRGLSLSVAERIVSGRWDVAWLDATASITLRTASRTAREALLRRSGTSDFVERVYVGTGDGEVYEEVVDRPNLRRADRVYVSATPGALTIRYNRNEESGTLAARGRHRLSTRRLTNSCSP